jgi:hypothetical protein
VLAWLLLVNFPAVQGWTYRGYEQALEGRIVEGWINLLLSGLLTYAAVTLLIIGALGIVVRRRESGLLQGLAYVR